MIYTQLPTRTRNSAGDETETHRAWLLHRILQRGRGNLSVHAAVARDSHPLSPCQHDATDGRRPPACLVAPEVSRAQGGLNIKRCERSNTCTLFTRGMYPLHGASCRPGPGSLNTRPEAGSARPSGHRQQTCKRGSAIPSRRARHERAEVGTGAVRKAGGRRG